MLLESFWAEDLGRQSVVHFHRICHGLYEALLRRPIEDFEGSDLESDYEAKSKDFSLFKKRLRGIKGNYRGMKEDFLRFFQRFSKFFCVESGFFGHEKRWPVTKSPSSWRKSGAPSLWQVLKGLHGFWSPEPWATKR